MSKKVIAVDIDDTLAAEAEYIVAQSNDKWGHALTLDDYQENWPSMWGISFEEAEKRAKKLQQEGIVSMYRVLDDAKSALMELSKHYKLVILTSRRQVVQAETERWLLDNFGPLFDEFHYTGFWDGGRKDAIKHTKAELAKEIGADYLVDDLYKHCASAAEVGVKCVLFGDYNHSKRQPLPNGVTRCKNWKEVLEYFKSES